MPKRFGVFLSISVLPSIRYDQLFKSSSRPARLILAVLGGFILLGLWLSVITRAQSSAQAAPTFQPCNAGPAVIARTHSSTATPPNDVITAASDPLCIKTDLRVAKTLNTATPQVGEAITYTVVVTNGGPDDATGVQLTDVLPESVTFGSAMPQNVCTEENNTITCDLGHLPNGDSATVTIVVTPTEAGMITNVASVTGNESDPDPSNNAAEKSVRVVGADLVVTKTVNITAPKIGDTITYTITAANNGPDEATGVQVIDVLPKEVAFDGYTATRGTYITATGLWNVDDMANAASATMTIAATVISYTGDPTIPNTASISAAWPNDPNLENNTSRAVITPTSANYCVYLPIILKPLPPPCHVENFDNSASGWKISPGPPTLLEYLNGKYHVFTQDTSVLHWARSPLGPYNDYSVQVDVNWTNTTYVGEEYGIVFDLSTLGSLVMYRFNINTNAGIYVLGRLQGTWTTLITGTSSDILTGTLTNTLKVDRKGSDIDLYINGRYQASYSDNALPRPAFVGINIVPDDLVNGEAYFDNFIICSYELKVETLTRLESISTSGVASKP
jgi:uncharacterized repeat protein (TIGR01451 family)